VLLASFVIFTTLQKEVMLMLNFSSKQKSPVIVHLNVYVNVTVYFDSYIMLTGRFRK
jgi:hypothetical protein